MEQNVVDGQKIENEQPEHPAEAQAELVEKPEAKVEAKPAVEAEQQEADGVGVIDAFAEPDADKKPKVEPEVSAEAPALSSSPDQKPEVEQKPEHQQQEEEREVGRYEPLNMTDDQKSSLIKHVKGEFSQRDQLAGKIAEIEQKQQQEKKQEVTADDRLEFLKDVNGRFELRDDISEKLAQATGKDRDTLERSLYLMDRQIKGDCRVLVERGFEKQLADDPDMRAKVEGSYQSDLSGHPGWRQSDLHVEVRKSSVPLTYYTQPAFSDPYVQKILARENEFRAEQQFLDGGPSELPAEYRQRMAAVEPQGQKVEKVAEVEGQKVEAKPENQQQGEPKAEARVEGQAEGQQQEGVKPGQEVEQKPGATVEQKEVGEGLKVEPSARVAVNSGEKVEAAAPKAEPTAKVAVDPGQRQGERQDGQVSAAKPTLAANQTDAQATSQATSQKNGEKLEIHRYADAVQLGRELHGERAAGRGKTERSQAIAGALVEADQRWSEEGANGWDARQYNGAEGRRLRAFVTMVKTEQAQQAKAQQAAPTASQARPTSQPRPVMTSKAMQQHARQQQARQQEISIDR